MAFKRGQHVLCWSFSSWWLNQPIWKICSSNWMISPCLDENKRYLKPPPRFLNAKLSLFPGFFSLPTLVLPGGKSGGGARGGCTEPLAWPTKLDALFQAFGFLSHPSGEAEIFFFRDSWGHFWGPLFGWIPRFFGWRIREYKSLTWLFQAIFGWIPLLFTTIVTHRRERSLEIDQSDGYREMSSCGSAGKWLGSMGYNHNISQFIISRLYPIY